jgi:hypothetical protein
MYTLHLILYLLTTYTFRFLFLCRYPRGMSLRCFRRRRCYTLGFGFGCCHTLGFFRSGSGHRRSFRLFINLIEQTSTATTITTSY